MTGYLERIEPATIPGRRCRDITPIFADPAAFSALVDDLVARLPEDAEVVVGIEAMGFILATAIAVRRGLGLVPIRKGGKLPVAADQVTADGEILELRAGALRPGQRALVVDDWMHGGAQMRAAVALVERQHAVVSAVVAINIDDQASSQPLPPGCRVVTVLRNGVPR
jgi:adenine phosphoribosyltransferase